VFLDVLGIKKLKVYEREYKEHNHSDAGDSFPFAHA
jgi:hypothetical protein